MAITKNHILNEIKRTAAENNGQPLGWRKFEAETGVKASDWLGKLWARWNDALREAGFDPNQLQRAYERTELFEKYARLAQELGQLPTATDLQLKGRGDSDFPSSVTFARAATKAEFVQQLSKFCSERDGYDDVTAMCRAYGVRSRPSADETAIQEGELGYVYLIKHGTRREYKIGRTNNALRREGEIGIELPEKVRPIHVIKTDDPSGIEAYWHKRFAGKRKNGEWFELSAADVAAFKRRKFM